MPRTRVGILKAYNTPKGSNILNLAAINKELIRKHSFREIREGRTPFFWEDSWQQKEKLFSPIYLGEIFLFKNFPSRRTIDKYWCQQYDKQWRKLKEKKYWREAPKTIQWNNLQKELKTKKGVATTGEDILRWGYQTRGMFSIQEGYYIRANNLHNIAVPIWKKIWSVKHWPKVEHFLWLLSHSKILTYG